MRNAPDILHLGTLRKILRHTGKISFPLNIDYDFHKIRSFINGMRINKEINTDIDFYGVTIDAYDLGPLDEHWFPLKDTFQYHLKYNEDIILSRVVKFIGKDKNKDSEGRTVISYYFRYV